MGSVMSQFGDESVRGGTAPFQEGLCEKRAASGRETLASKAAGACWHHCHGCTPTASEQFLVSGRPRVAPTSLDHRYDKARVSGRAQPHPPGDSDPARGASVRLSSRSLSGSRR